MDTLEAIRTRRSIRKYRIDPVSRDLIETVIDAGRLAATGGNKQPWEFVVVTESEKRAQLAAIGGHGKFIAQAAVCIAVFAGEGITPFEDCAAAAENMLLAARALGLGTCWVGNPRASFAEKAREFLSVPERFKFFALIALGYPDDSPQPAKRALTDVLHWETF